MEKSEIGLSDGNGFPGQAPTHQLANIDNDVAPPPYFAPTDLNQKNLVNTIKPFNASLTNQDALNALLAHISKSCCLGKGAVKKMEIKNIEYNFIHLYVLESFCEKRQTCWEYKPFKGGHVDDRSFGMIPDVWSILPTTEPVPFKNDKFTTVVPHSEYIQSCHNCNFGRRRCIHCDMGSSSCNFCNNTGQVHGSSCTFCNGRGRKSCFSCQGSGFQDCLTCNSSGKLKYYQKLKITWINHISEWVSTTDIPKDKLKLVVGDTIFKDKAPRVYPVIGPIQQINEISQSFINDHERNYLVKERPLIQQQMVQVIQVANVHYEYKGKPNIFYLFGKDSPPKVHAPGYPKNYCIMC